MCWSFIEVSKDILNTIMTSCDKETSIIEHQVRFIASQHSYPQKNVDIKRSKIDDVDEDVILTSPFNGPTMWGHISLLPTLV